MKGLDVSSHNGIVDWDAVRNAGYGDFAIVRLGIGSDYTNQDDAKFETNIRALEARGIPYGIYLYSYALNIEDAKSEANHALRQAKKCGPNFKCGIWFDMEDADNYKKKHGMPSNSMLVDICYTFCEIVEAAGYYTGIYASLSYLNNELAGSKLDRFDKWVAQWNNNSQSSYRKHHSIWQYTSDLIIGGKRFDSNKLINKFWDGGSAPQPSTNIEQLARDVIAGKYGNGEERRKALGSLYDQVQKRVNEILNGGSRKSNEEIADEVIAGAWGNGDERKSRLTSAGYDYDAIQKIVNQKLNATQCYPRYTGGSPSIVDALSNLGINSSFDNRKKIAERNGISNYRGTADQNTKMLELLKQGRLVK